MRGRTWLLILGMGIGGFLALGLLTKYALESNPDILRIGRVKAAIAEGCSSRGVETVTLKVLPGRTGYEIRAEVPRAGGGDPETLSEEIGESFLRNYRGPAPAILKVKLIEPGRFGCQGSQVYSVKDVRVVDLAREIAIREASERLASALASRPGFRMLPASPEEPLRVAVEIPPPRDPADLEGAAEFLRSMVRKHLGSLAGRGVVLEIRGGPGSPVLREENVEPFRGRWQRGEAGGAVPARAPHPPPSGPPGDTGR